MEPSEFPSNARKQQRDGPAKQEAPKKVSRVVSGDVVRRKKPVLRRISESFIDGSPRGVWGYVLLDVLIPAAKDMVAEAVSTGFDRMLFGESRSRRRGSPPPGGQYGYTPYNRYSGGSRREEPPRKMSQRSRATHDFDEIILGTRVEAEEVIDKLLDHIERYETATVADLYEMCGISSNFVDQRWGWTDLRGAGVSRVRNGYLLDLPRPENLD